MKLSPNLQKMNSVSSYSSATTEYFTPSSTFKGLNDTSYYSFTKRSDGTDTDRGQTVNCKNTEFVVNESFNTTLAKDLTKANYTYPNNPAHCSKTLKPLLESIAQTDSSNKTPNNVSVCGTNNKLNVARHDSIKSEDIGKFRRSGVFNTNCYMSSEKSPNTFDSLNSTGEFEDPSLEYDASWDPQAQSSPVKLRNERSSSDIVSKQLENVSKKDTFSPGKSQSLNAIIPMADTGNESYHKILMRELSFENETVDVQGVDLMAPVFLAVATDNDDVSRLFKRKAMSIQDLCSPALNDKELYSRHRSCSDLACVRRKLLESQPYGLNTIDDNTDPERLLSENNSTTRSERSSVTRLNSFNSDIYNESIDDSLEDEAMMEVFINNNMYGSDLDEVNTIASFMTEQDQDDTLQRSANFGSGEISSGIGLSEEGINEVSIWSFGPETPISNKNQVERRVSRVNTSPSSRHSHFKYFSPYVVVNVCGSQKIVDLTMLEPYLKILTHGGFHEVDGERRVIVVFNVCFLPASHVEKYHVIMEQLFYYCVHALDLLVPNTYEIVVFNSQVESSKAVPPVMFIKQCYEMIQYRLKKNLKNIYFVHQNLWLKTMICLSQLFTSAKFRKKMCFVKNLRDLQSRVPLEFIYISPEIYRADKKFS